MPADIFRSAAAGTSGVRASEMAGIMRPSEAERRVLAGGPLPPPPVARFGAEQVSVPPTPTPLSSSPLPPPPPPPLPVQPETAPSTQRHQDKPSSVVAQPQKQQIPPHQPLPAFNPPLHEAPTAVVVEPASRRRGDQLRSILDMQPGQSDSRFSARLPGPPTQQQTPLGRSEFWEVDPSNVQAALATSKERRNATELLDKSSKFQGGTLSAQGSLWPGRVAGARSADEAAESDYQSSEGGNFEGALQPGGRGVKRPRTAGNSAEPASGCFAFSVPIPEDSTEGAGSKNRRIGRGWFFSAIAINAAVTAALGAAALAVSQPPSPRFVLIIVLMSVLLAAHAALLLVRRPASVALAAIVLAVCGLASAPFAASFAEQEVMACSLAPALRIACADLQSWRVLTHAFAWWSALSTAALAGTAAMASLAKIGMPPPTTLEQMGRQAIESARQTPAASPIRKPPKHASRPAASFGFAPGQDAGMVEAETLRASPQPTWSKYRASPREQMRGGTLSTTTSGGLAPAASTADDKARLALERLRSRRLELAV